MARKITALITNGPSKFDLMLALFDSTREHPRSVEFSYRIIEEGDSTATGPVFTAEVGIMGVEQEDASGESWNLRGGLETPRIGMTAFKPLGVSIEAYYSTKRREGTLRFIYG